MSAAAPSAHAAHWDLDPDVTFLNHGSFGACPRIVLAHQTELRARLEREPVLFLHRQLEGLLDEARHELARLVRCDADDLAFVPNATAGVNTVLRSLSFAPGDELLVTDQEYNACRNALDFVAERSGARVVVAPIALPIVSPRDVVDTVIAHTTPRTRLLLIDHVTSQSGVVLPVEPIVHALVERGIDTLVDGAHAPGMLPLDLRALGAAYYTGNCHKWLCSPKGAALLHVRADRQRTIRPLSISHGANSARTDRTRFRLEFDFTGTDDPTPYLCVPAALRFLESLLPGGLPALQEHNRSLALRARELLVAALRTIPLCPDEMIGSLAAVEVRGGPADLHSVLWERHRIEAPVMQLGARRLLRVAPQAYNTAAQFEHLAAVLTTLLR